VSGKITAMLPLPFATTDFKYFIVVKLGLNVVSDTVFVAAVLTPGINATTMPPTNARQARALPVLNFIVPQPIRGISTMPDFNLLLCEHPVKSNVDM
jgi:hypothetical protein